MELVQGMTGELQPGPYVDCPEEDCAYTLQEGILHRYPRGADRLIAAEAIAVDVETDAADHERPRLRRIARMLTESAKTARLASPFVVFVPRQGDLVTQGILAGSGIVGAPAPGAERVAIYYEGARYGQMARLGDRVFYAYSRLSECYPSVARMAAPRSSLVEVAAYDISSGAVVPIDAQAEAALAAWLGCEELDPAELGRSEGAL